MKIVLIGNLPEDRQESMRRFAELLAHGLRSRGHDVTVLAPRLCFARLGPRYRYGGVAKYLGYIDKFVLFPRTLRRHLAVVRPEVVHLTDHAGAVYRSAVKKVPVVATCHDLLQIRSARGEIAEQRVGRAGRSYQAWILQSLTRLAQIACVSEQTRRDVLRLTGLRESQAPVIFNALNYPYARIPVDAARARLAGMVAARGLHPASFDAARGGFILNVGGAHWYKNRPGLLAIHAGLSRILSPAPALVIVGPPLSAKDASALAPNQRFIRLDEVTHSELEALYTLAEGLLFPSWQEGFGWPIAEAQACGCPVFTSNRAPMTEVGGGTAVYFDPSDPSGAAQAIAAAWESRECRRAPALAHSQRWQPERMLRAYEDLYRRAV